MIELTASLAARGWVLRLATYDYKTKTHSDPILVRGARVQDDPFDHKHGFVYAETAESAEAYDAAHGYA